jgi:anti-anti-sigma regulatory factor
VIQNDSTKFESAQRDGPPVLVKLSGEFDIRYLRTLENMLRDCLASGRSTLVDLSEVTFMDSPVRLGVGGLLPARQRAHYPLQSLPGRRG